MMPGIVCLAAAGFFIQPALAQYAGGGSSTGIGESTLGEDIYSGGSERGASSASTTQPASLAYGPARRLVFLVSPSTSKNIFPSVGSSSLNKSRSKVVLPAPEAPTIETNSLGLILRVTFFNAIELSLYILDTLSKKIIY